MGCPQRSAVNSSRVGYMILCVLASSRLHHRRRHLLKFQRGNRIASIRGWSLTMSCGWKAMGRTVIIDGCSGQEMFAAIFAGLSTAIALVVCMDTFSFFVKLAEVQFGRVVGAHVFFVSCHSADN